MSTLPQPTDPDAELRQRIGATLRQARLRRNLSQAELAQGIGIGRRTLQSAEDGASVTLETLIAILRGLDLLWRIERLLVPPVTGCRPSPGARRQRVSRGRGTDPKKAGNGPPT